MKNLIKIILICMVFLSACISANAFEKFIPKKQEREIVVKFSPEVQVNVKDAKKFNDEKLNDLFEEYEGRKVKKVFKKAVDLETLKERFPERAARMPQDAEAPDIANVYVLTISTNKTLTDVCAQWAKHELVEYAHPQTSKEANAK